MGVSVVAWFVCVAWMGRVGIQSHSLALEPDSSVIFRGRRGVLGFLFNLFARFKKDRADD